MSAQEAFISTVVLKWARQRYFATPEAAAAKFGLPKYPLWEAGKARPSFKQAQALASRLHVPFGYFFLDSPPKDDLPLPDLRTIANQPVQRPSPDFLEVVQDSLRKQEWYREYARESGAQPLSFVGRFKETDDPVSIANYMRSTFGLDEVLDVADRPTFLRVFTKKVEDLGVLVLRSHVVGSNVFRKLDVREFRGFVISDEIAPLIFINAEDFEGAQIFTFAHELAHILVGVTGISNPNYRRAVGQQYNPIENLCDRVAAEALMPKRDFLLWWRDFDSIESNLNAITSRYKASTMAALRRANELGKVTDAEFWIKYDDLANRQRPPKRDEGGGDPYATMFVRHSRKLTETMVEAISEGRLLRLDAATMLGVRVQTVNEAARVLFGAPINA